MKTYTIVELTDKIATSTAASTYGEARLIAQQRALQGRGPLHIMQRLDAFTPAFNLETIEPEPCEVAR